MRHLTLISLIAALWLMVPPPQGYALMGAALLWGNWKRADRLTDLTASGLAG